MTPSEIEQHAWLRELPPSERSELEQTWHLASLGKEPEPNTKAVSDAWASVANRLDEDTESGKAVPSRFRLISIVPPLRWAAAIALLAMAVGYFSWTRPVLLDAAQGETLETNLPDGSIIHLASGSSLSFSKGLWGNTRNVSLKGEAFFDVVSMDTPFIIETFNASIEVLGTRFNVRAREDDATPKTIVALEKGSVQLATSQGNDEVVLAPGQFSEVSTSGSPPTEPELADMDRILSWREGGFAFNNHPLSTVLAEIERRYAVRIDLDNEIADDSLTLFHNRPDNIEILLDAIVAYKGYQYQVTGTGFSLIP